MKPEMLYDLQLLPSVRICMARWWSRHVLPKKVCKCLFSFFSILYISATVSTWRPQRLGFVHCVPQHKSHRAMIGISCAGRNAPLQYPVLWKLVFVSRSDFVLFVLTLFYVLSAFFYSFCNYYVCHWKGWTAVLLCTLSRGFCVKMRIISKGI